MWRALVSLILLTILILFVWRFSHSAASNISSPISEVKDTIDKLKEAVSDPNLQGLKNKLKRESRIREIISARIDFDEMGRRSIGANWRKLKPEEKNEYLRIFRLYVDAFYRKRVFESLDFINNLGVKYLDEKLDGDFAEVSIEINTPDNSSISIVFKLRFFGGHWLAYDIVTENISEVLNLRAQFTRIIHKKSFKELIRLLEEKVKELNK